MEIGCSPQKSAVLSNSTMMTCPACQGDQKGLLYRGVLCKRCDSFGAITQIDIANPSSNTELKNSGKVVFQEKLSLSWSDQDLKALDQNYSAEHTLSPQRNDFKKPIDKESKSRLGQIINFLIGLLTLILMLWLLYSGIQGLRSKLTITKPELDKPVDDKDGEKVESEGKGNIYDYNPAIKYRKYNSIDMKMIEQNKGLQRFINKSIEPGNKKKNQREMSEKGVFHICKSFGAHANDCRDRWFRSRKDRQAFAKRIDDIYKENGEVLFDK